MDDLGSIGLVGGGQMGEALIRGMIDAGVLNSDNLMVVEPDGDRRVYLKKTYSIRVTEDAAELAKSCSILILAVKPQVVGKVLEQYKSLIGNEHLVISIAAGVTLKTIEIGLGEDIRIIRVMPNTPVLVQEGASALSPNKHASGEDMDAIEQEMGEALEGEQDPFVMPTSKGKGGKRSRPPRHDETLYDL